jgi:adenosylcobinamide hydrolase
LTASELLSAPPGEGGLPVLVWRFDQPMTAASTASAGGGVGIRRWVVNAQVPSGYSRRDPERHVDELASALDLAGPGVGMLTAADVASVVRIAETGVRVEATVGISHPVWAASDEPAQGEPRVGTINVVAFLPVPLSEAALLNALCTATEAKTQALLMAGVDGTGTASDAITVVCSPRGVVEPFGGPRSRWGAPLARVVCAAVRTGCTPRAGAAAERVRS